MKLIQIEKAKLMKENIVNKLKFDTLDDFETVSDTELQYDLYLQRVTSNEIIYKSSVNRDAKGLQAKINLDSKYGR